ncbi:MAG: aminotransferase class V-fold PLP-dependent enzyme [Clostridiales bacterium]|nr:aminotransferase class V-fold PLP-dependent enzyme [Clostridiales bacterium]
MIYLDNAATTKVFDAAARAAESTMLTDYFNPNATYKSAVAVNNSIEQARNIIAHAVGANSDELIFTSGATESNNWVFNCGIKNHKGNIVITAGEHSSVYEVAMQFKRRGKDVRIAPLNSDGTVDEQALLRLVDDNTALVSMIHVSNETGAVNPIKSLAAAVRQKSPNALIHSDGVQALLKSGLPINGLGVDYYSASAHKIGAPKGIGFLYMRRGLNMSPYIVGGGQEHGLRSGTQNTPYIAAFASAVQEYAKHNNGNIPTLRAELCEYFTSRGFVEVGRGQNSGFILCLCAPKYKAEILQNIVHDKGVIIGKGAACSGSKRGNRVLSAIGVKPDEIERCIRLSLFVDTTREDAFAAAKIIADACNR